MQKMGVPLFLSWKDQKMQKMGVLLFLMSDTLGSNSKHQAYACCQRHGKCAPEYHSYRTDCD